MSYALKGDSSFDGLDFEQTINAIIELRKNILYFATSNSLPRSDRLCVMPETDIRPEYLACHPDDYDHLTDKLKLEFALVPISEYQPGKLTKAESSVISKKIDESFREVLELDGVEFSIAKEKLKNSLRSIFEMIKTSDVW